MAVTSCRRTIAQAAMLANRVSTREGRRLPTPRDWRNDLALLLSWFAILALFSRGRPAVSVRIHQNAKGIISNSDFPKDLPRPAFHLSEEELAVVTRSILSNIAMEMNLLCPGEKEVHAESFEVHCCGYALRENFQNHSQYRLSITVDDQIFVARLRGDLLPENGSITGLPLPHVETVEPPACNKVVEEPEAGQFENVDVSAIWVRLAKEGIDIRLNEECASQKPNGTVIGVRNVPFAQSKIVQGFILRLVVDLADEHALHEIEVSFDMEAEIEQIVWPSYIKEHGICSLLNTSTIDSVHLEEIAALAADPDVAGNHKAASLYYIRLNGHIPVLDKTVPLEAPETLSSLLERAEESTLPSIMDLREEFPKCFGPTVVKRQGLCGSCWIMSAIGAIGDRHCLRRPELMTGSSGGTLTLSTQQVLSCHHRNGCAGGHPMHVFRSMLEDGMHLALERDYPYAVRCFVDQGGVVEEEEDLGPKGCAPYRHLNNTDKKKPCACIAPTQRPQEQPPCNTQLDAQGRFGLRDFKRLPTPGVPKSPFPHVGSWTTQEVNTMIMQSLYEAGSLIAGFTVYGDWMPFLRQTGGKQVYQWNRHAPKMGAHAVVMCGWGLSNRVPFWVMRNSYGKNWGDGGYYKHYRGQNDCNVEGDILVPYIADLIRTQGKNTGHGGKSSDKNAGVAAVEFCEEVSEVRLNGGASPTWTFTAKCSASPCKPTLVALQTVTMDPSKTGASCCCDTSNYNPPKCLWVPKEAQQGSDMIDWFVDRGPCGSYDFGRGQVSTQEIQVHQAKQMCGNQMLGGQQAQKVLKLKPTMENNRTFKVEYNLKKDFKFGRHELRVQVGEAEQLYEVQISKKDGTRPVKRLHALVGLEHFFHREDEPVRFQSMWGEEWGTRSVYQLRVVGKCTGACRGTAVFPNKAAMHQERSGGPNSLVFSQPLETLPPGLHLIEVTAHFQAGGQASKFIDVEVPNWSH